jgi:tetraacyldisaccharide 4'-kinase
MNRAMSLALTPLASLFGAVTKTRNVFYRRGFFRIENVGLPVVSIGNLTTGGTGKTPLVERLTAEIARTRRVCILTRGYGRQASGRVIVSNGHEILADAQQAGDEPLLLAESLLGRAAVISDADRISAAHFAIENFKSQVFVLDDGFQHQRLARNLNILTIDATAPWGNGKLLPAGNLREHPTAIARADCVVVTRADDLRRFEKLVQEIRSLKYDGPIFRSQMKLNGGREVTKPNQSASLTEFRASPVAAFCGIGNPESFFSLLRRDHWQLCHTAIFRDHHDYTQTDIDKLRNESLAQGATALVTTAKDEVKLRSLDLGLPCLVVDLEIEIYDSDKLIAQVIQAAGTKV